MALYDHLRDTTQEGETPTLAILTSLYQAIAHGCRAGRYQQALEEVFWLRICRRNEFYASRKLGAIGSDLAAVSWFFDKPFEVPVIALSEDDRAFVLNHAALRLVGYGRLTEALQAQRASLRLVKRQEIGNVRRSPSATSSTANYYSARSAEL